MSREIRIAQANVMCEVGQHGIKAGNPYTWVHKKHKNHLGNEIVKVLRSCPKCAEGLE